MRERANRGSDAPVRYRIVVAGRLGSEWALYFDGLELSVETRPDGSATTALAGCVADQAALFGLLARIRDVGLPLIAVAREEDAERH